MIGINKLKIITVVASFLLLISCAAPYLNSLPDGYMGDTATIDDSIERKSRGKADMFYVQNVDGRQIYTALDASTNASAGRGFQLVAKGASRAVPAQTIQLYLVGRSNHSAPIASAVDKNMYSVSGVVEFTPIANEYYLVNGRLGREKSSIWLEDIHGNVVSNVITRTAEGTKVVPWSTDSIKLKKKMKRTETEFFYNVKIGESWDLVKYKLGDSTSSLIQKGNFLNSDSYPTVTHDYGGLGSIRFTTVNANGDKYFPAFVDRVSPSVIVADESVESLAIKLSSNNASTLQALAQSFYLHDNNSVEVLDLFADKIMENYNTHDKYMANALAWFCKVIGKSRNSRYESMLGIVKRSKSDKMRRYAKSSLKLLSGKETEQYVYSKK